MSERIYETYVGSRRLLALVMCGVGIMTADFRMSAQPAPAQSPVFRSSINLVLVDVVVKDKRGAMVRGLTANDFELREDGVRQQILTFAFEEIGTNAAPLAGAVSLAATATKPATVPSTDRATASASSTKPATSEDVAGHRLITIVFDTSSMQPEDVQRAADSATTWVDDHMTSADLVAVATIGSTLRVLADFTSSKEAVRAVLSGLSSAEGTAFAAVDTSTAATDAASVAATTDSTPADQSAQELGWWPRVGVIERHELACGFLSADQHRIQLAGASLRGSAGDQDFHARSRNLFSLQDGSADERISGVGLGVEREKDLQLAWVIGVEESLDVFPRADVEAADGTDDRHRRVRPGLLSW